MECFLHIKPTFNCLVKSNNLQEELTKNRLHTFLVNIEKSLSLSFYPIDEEYKNSLPFVCVLNADENKLTTSKNQIDIISFPDNNYLLKVNPFLFCYPQTFNIKTKQIKIKNITHTITWIKDEPCSLTVSNDDNDSFLKIETNQILSDITIKQKDNYVLGFAKCNNYKYFVFSFEYSLENYKLITSQVVDILEEENNKIITYKNLNDFAGHGVITTYNFENGFEENISLAYNNSSPIIAKHKEVIPYAFFEAIKVKNYKLARTYLSEPLSKKLTNTHLQKFFGDFIEIHQSLSKNYNPEEIALVYNSPQKYAKVFYLKINQQNKIENITEQ